MYKNIRDAVSILAGIGLLVLLGLAVSGVISYDHKKYSPGPPLVFGLALIVGGVWPLWMRRNKTRSE